MDEDIKLMLELKQGNRAAFDVLLKKHEKRVINYIYRFTGRREDAEDLAQETFIKVFNAAVSYYPSAKFTTWLYRIASNVSIDYLRKKKHERGTESLNERLENEEGGIERQAADDKIKPAEQEVLEKEASDRINKALLSLPENQRAAIILKVYEDRSYADIAATLAVSVPSVESLLFRARQALKGILSKEK